MATPKTWVEAPPREKRPNTSLDVIPVHEVQQGHYMGIEYIVDPCVFPGLVSRDCYIDIGENPGTQKAFGTIGNDVDTAVFGVYSGVECYLNGDVDEFAATAQRLLEHGEHYAVDGVIYPSIGGFAGDLGTASTIVGVVAALEDALAKNVPARGYIHLSPGLATRAASENLLIRNLDGSLETYLGTPVVVYTNPNPSMVAYATGPMNIWRTPVIVSEGPSLTTNRARALAERLYTYSVECGAWKVSLVIPAIGPTPTPMPLTMILGTIPASPIPVGTDTTAGVTTSVQPTSEVYLWYKVNGGAAISLGEMTETGTLSFVMNIAGGSLGLSPGDEVEAWAESTYNSASVESNHIIVEVIA